MRRGDFVGKLQQTRPPQGRIVTAQATALQGTVRTVGGIRQCCLDCSTEIELPVAVRIRAAVFEKCAGRRIQHMRLRGRYASSRPLEAQLDAKVLERRKRRAQRLRGRPIATQLVHSPLASGSGWSELHGPRSGSGCCQRRGESSTCQPASVLSPALRSQRARRATVAPRAPPPP
jgi:hypothetical protein